MHATVWCMFTALLIPAFTAALSPKYFISSPNVIRVGVEETIIINVFGDINTGADGIPITVTLEDHPAATTTLATEIALVQKNDPKRITLRVSPDKVPETPDTDEPQYVYLRARCDHPNLVIDKRTPILLSYRAGHVFLQTDKPIYTPNQKVNIRLVSVNQQLRPSEEQVRIDILNPQGITVKRYNDIVPDAGFFSQTYVFPGVPAFGNWSVVAFYGHGMKHNSTVQFLVKEYVLPRYSVKINLQPAKYILPSTEQINTVIHGDYVFGERVNGFYRIKYSLLDTDGTLELVKDGVNGSLNSNDQAISTLTISDIIGTNDFDDFLGKKLHIEAFIVEGATGKVESANNTVLEFVDSPFVFSWAQTMKFFKTNLPFEVKADVLYSYGDPVPDLPVRVSAVARTPGGPRDLESVEDLKRTSRHGRVSFTLNVPADTQHIDVTMTTEYGRELANFERTGSYDILPFDSEGNNALLIRPSAQVFSVSETIDVDLVMNGAGNENADVMFTYIVAGGKIIQADAIENIDGALKVTDIDITQDMVPSARMVAFYVNEAGKVIADMVWIDVEDQCENSVEIEVPVINGRTYYRPKDTVNLQLTAKQQTKIALLAVDTAVYLLQDYHRLNKKKIFSKMASYDLGCGPGGGSNTQDIFDNAGITVLTNAEFQTNEREGLDCNEHNRKRRSIGESELRLNDLRARYEGDPDLLEACTKGARDLGLKWTCENRMKGLMNRTGLPSEHPYIRAFNKCCMAVSQASGRSGGRGDTPPQPKVNYDDVTVRSDFRESFLFEQNLVDIGDDEDGSITYPISLPESITTWIVQATGVSPLHGMCVAEPQEIVVRRKYFVDVALPYSVMRMEQVAIVATVFNYDDDVDQDGNGRAISVIVEMEEVEGLCADVRPIEGRVEANNAKSFTFIVIPLEVQDYIITVYMFSGPGNDAVQKTLHVVPEGIPQVKPLSIVLDPSGIARQLPDPEQAENQVVEIPEKNLKHEQQSDQANRNQGDTVILALPEDAVPNTAKCDVSLIGSLLGPIASATIDGLNAGKFLNGPRGCGEQTMIYTAPNVYIIKYLKSIGRDGEVEKQATKNIEDGIAREVNNYRTDDGAFKTFSHTPGNSWLTAFVLRVFSAAKEFAEVDDKVICEGLKWLQGIQNDADGSFAFTYKTWHGSSFMGGVDEPVPLTAFVLVTFAESNCPGLDTSTTVSRASAYLEGKLDSIAQDHHSLALVTYALALVNSARASEANTQLKTLATDNLAQGTKHFGSSNAGPLTVETTSYALLAQIALEEISYSYPVVLWLMAQRDQIGNWYSTQDTMVALQALSEYTQRAGTGDIDMTCTGSATADQRFQSEWQINEDNALLLQSTQAPTEGELHFTTIGSGIATLSINLHYNKASGNQNLCPFEVEITPKDVVPDPLPPGARADEEPKLKLSLEVCAKYIGEGKTNMAIIDVGLVSGFTPIKESLKKVTRETALIQAYEISDRSVVFYADQIPGGEGVEPLCVVFEAEQSNKVGNVQPVPVKVYDYYLPDKECVKFYRPDGASPVLPTLCAGDVCQCAAAHCLDTDLEMRTNPVALKLRACESAEHFAYRATFVEAKDKDTFTVFIMRITWLKRGLDNDIQVDQTRQFWKSTTCEHPKMEAGNDYLIVGKGGVAIKDENHQVSDFKHYIDGDFIISHWPRDDDQYKVHERECIRELGCENGDRKCRKPCLREHRPVWKELKEYYEKVEEGFMNGCDQ